MDGISELDALEALFTGHGLRVVRGGGWISVEGTTAPHFRSLATPLRPEGGTVRLDVEVAVSDRYTIVESFAGIGAMAEEAMRSAPFGGVLRAP